MENREANQTAFEKVVRHLLKQGGRSVSSGDDYDGLVKCLYRGPLGRSCAVGCLIPDSEYSPEMNSTPTGVLRLLRVFDPPSLRGLDRHLLSELQRAHDKCEPDTWRAVLMGIAASYCLTMPDLEV